MPPTPARKHTTPSLRTPATPLPAEPESEVEAGVQREYYSPVETRPRPALRVAAPPPERQASWPPAVIGLIFVVFAIAGFAGGIKLANWYRNSKAPAPAPAVVRAAAAAPGVIPVVGEKSLSESPSKPAAAHPAAAYASALTTEGLGENEYLSLKITLPPGVYEYKFHCHPEHWMIDPLNPQYSTTGGIRNSAFRVPGGAVDPSGKRAKWPSVDDATGEVTFYFPNPRGVAAAYVCGNFNKWADVEDFRMTPKPLEHAPK